MQGQLWLLLFVMVRIGAALIAAPIFGTRAVPVQVRIVLAAGLGIFILNWMPVQMPGEMLALPTFVALLSEAVIGFTLGFVLQLAFSAPLIAGEQIAGGMGMAMATAVDPSSGAQSGAIGQMLGIMLTLIFLAIGGHLLWLRLVVESYLLFPPGAEWDVGVRGWLIASFASQALATAVAIALPITMVLLLVQLVTGVISRSAPSLNLFALGLPASVLAGLASLIVASPLLTEQFVGLAESAIDQAGLAVQP
ncbi:flagellar biosynthetic protein FliR [Alteraurantiacibacter aquimixticola]|uniref:Flagellar biosynthetic protein FliR n=2 Tax=Alteraurantiacibacter aquimixticola TaxID=2489173 RepID=A0A4T3FAM5_9SPHN|nr:flagellar biosynthetic protein FliR [Alteraurantiacibacter aquimixticola]